MNAIARKLPTVVRIGLGFMFALSGLDKLVPLLPPPPLSRAGAELLEALGATGYMLPLVALTEIVAGVMLLTGRFTTLGLALIAPVIVNTLAFHVFLSPAGLSLAFVILALELYLAWSYRDAFAAMLSMRGMPRPRAMAGPKGATVAHGSRPPQASASWRDRMRS